MLTPVPEDSDPSGAREGEYGSFMRALTVYLLFSRSTNDYQPVAFQPEVFLSTGLMPDLIRIRQTATSRKDHKRSSPKLRSSDKDFMHGDSLLGVRVYFSCNVRLWYYPGRILQRVSTGVPEFRRFVKCGQIGHYTPYPLLTCCSSFLQDALGRRSPYR